MSISYWCILIAALLPYGFIILAKSMPGYDNRQPREYLKQLTGWRQRAYWTEQNGFEAFPFFAAAVLTAIQLEVPQIYINSLALVFIFMRILHGIFYIADKHLLRSLAWFVGFFCCIGLFLISIK